MFDRSQMLLVAPRAGIGIAAAAAARVNVQHWDDGGMRDGISQDRLLGASLSGTRGYGSASTRPHLRLVARFSPSGGRRARTAALYSGQEDYWKPWPVPTCN